VIDAVPPRRRMFFFTALSRIAALASSQKSITAAIDALKDYIFTIA